MKEINGLRDHLSYEQIKEAATYVFEKTKCKAKIAVVCDFGLDTLVDRVLNKIVIPYSLIPNFPPCFNNQVAALIVGTISEFPVICCQRSFQLYDGYTIQECAIVIRMLKILGVKYVLLTNSACGINPDYEVGDIMIIKDHINILGFSGTNPLMGPNEDKFGIRFPAMTRCYDSRFVEQAKNILYKMKFDKASRIGVYAVAPGPNYETRAEYLFLENCGIDAVGTSIVPEVIVARHCGIAVLALSLIASKNSEDCEKLSREDVLKVCRNNSMAFTNFFVKFVKYIMLQVEN